MKPGDVVYVKHLIREINPDGTFLIDLVGRDEHTFTADHPDILTASPKDNGWISCEDKTPTVDGKYLCFQLWEPGDDNNGEAHHYIDVYEWQEKFKDWIDDEYVRFFKKDGYKKTLGIPEWIVCVTHWMPLPEGPKDTGAKK